MWFRMLGPLEVVSRGQPIPLGGSKQRATLGFLMLQPNQVVPTSQLLRALWSVEDAPTTARKILQNAIWGLRRALAEGGGEDTSVVLKTQAPGYVLQADRERIDLHQFQSWVNEGRAQLTAGAPQEASALLRDALGLWRGPVLSDLVEIGVLWPEVTTVQNTRLDVLEDFFEAQLACGRHYAVLGELAAMVENEPLRERSCGQLMRALYRCGRHADALGVYSRLRAMLVEDLGLEPSRELQLLQQSILTHDASLELSDAATGIAPLPRQRTLLSRPAPEPAPTAPRPEPGAWVRRRAGMLLVRTELGREFETAGNNSVKVLLDDAASRARREIERYGGVAAWMGDVCLGLFPAESERDNHAERAVRAATAIRDGLTDGRGAYTGAAAAHGIFAQAAVTTGETLIRLGSEDGPNAPSVNGTLLKECQALLAQVPKGEIQVCGSTRYETAPQFDYLRIVGSPDRWQMQGVIADRRPFDERHARQLTEERLELLLVDQLTGPAAQHSRPQERAHLVTVPGCAEPRRASVHAQLPTEVLRAENADSTAPASGPGQTGTAHAGTDRGDGAAAGTAVRRHAPSHPAQPAGSFQGMSEMTDYTGKKAVITGGTHGMGLAIAQALLDGGAEVLVTGRNEKNIEAARTALGATAHVVRSDAGNLEHIAQLAKTVQDKLDRIDYVFINAGTAILEPFTAVTEETFDQQINVNTKGAFFAAQFLAPLIQDGGSIVFTSSVADQGGTPGMSVYSGSKAALFSFTQVIASELLPRNIRVNAVSPGFIDTPSMGVPGLSEDEKAGFVQLGDTITPMKRHGSVQEIARAALYLAADATYTTGSKLPVDGGLGQGVQYPQQ